MNEKLQEALVTLLNHLIAGLEFGAEQMPEVLMDVMKWNALVSGIFGVIGIILMLISFFFILCMVKKFTFPDGDGDDMSGPVAALSIIGFVIGAAWFLGTLEWLQIWVAPKAWTLEYLRDFVQSVQ